MVRYAIIWPSQHPPKFVLYARRNQKWWMSWILFMIVQNVSSFTSMDCLHFMRGYDLWSVSWIYRTICCLNGGREEKKKTKPPQNLNYSPWFSKFAIYTKKTARMYVKLYKWYYMPATEHNILIHGAYVIYYAMVPLGQLSEEVQESRHKEVRRFREYNTRKSSWV